MADFSAQLKEGKTITEIVQADPRYTQYADHWQKFLDMMQAIKVHLDAIEVLVAKEGMRADSSASFRAYGKAGDMIAQDIQKDVAALAGTTNSEQIKEFNTFLAWFQASSLAGRYGENMELMFSKKKDCDQVISSFKLRTPFKSVMSVHQKPTRGKHMKYYLGIE